ncbi:MAG: hypothetical protein ACK559_35210, partial [bacterium]
MSNIIKKERIMKPSGKREDLHIKKPQSNETYVPILQWTSNFRENNLRSWKEQVEIYALREFGHLGLIFEDNAYYVPPEVELPTTEDNSDPFSAENDPHGLILED